MNIIVTGRHMEVTNALRNYIEEKITKVDRYLKAVNEAVVTLSVEKYRHKVEVHLKADGVIIQAEEETEEMYSAIDKVMDKIERRIKKYKGKLIRHKNRITIPQKKVSGSSDEGETIPRIIKIKRFDMKPMSADESLMQMELLDKSFFVFSNVVTGDINVIYRRNDGNVGLIEPITKSSSQLQ
ncbi:MAG: ribosome-associated translation inhibitor RaiA [Nitrospirota bacterium]